MSILYDAGVLVAADRNSRTVWAEHRARLELGVVPLTTAPVVAQASRSTTQTALHRLLTGCAVLAFDAADAHAVGALCGKATSADVVDAHLVHVAAATKSAVITGDPSDLSALADHLGDVVRIIAL